MRNTSRTREPVPVDSEAIRRRLQREYLVVRAPAVLDGAAAVELYRYLLDGTADTDVVVDLRDVVVCGPDAVEWLCAAARGLRDVNATLTLSHLSGPAEAALADEGDLAVRRRRR
jgi:hypothetical protein